MPTRGSEAGGGVGITAMQITFKLFAGLTEYLPAEHRRGNQMVLEVEPDAPIARIIEPFHMPPHLVHIVLVNGVYVPPEERAGRTLHEGDVLAIWPPVAGG